MKTVEYLLFGSKAPGWMGKPPSILAAGEKSPSGNIIIRAGHMLSEHPGWESSEHIVLTPAEARELVALLTELTET